MNDNKRAIFDAYCRQPGTRCADIMDRIERGESDREIGRRYPSTGFGEDEKRNIKIDAAVIAVYRKAFNGELGGQGRIRGQSGRKA